MVPVVIQTRYYELVGSEPRFSHSLVARAAPAPALKESTLGGRTPGAAQGGGILLVVRRHWPALHNYTPETITGDWPMGVTILTQQRQHFADSASFTQASRYPSGQIRFLFMTPPPDQV
jgi:hypothetical protein